MFAAGGLGSIGCAVVMGQRGLPRRDITFMYVVWTLATVAVAGYGLANAVWQLMLASLAFNALETAGTIVWATAKQRHVPPALLGRVSSLDWLISIGLLPLSFALTGPVSGAIGPQATMVGAGLIGGVVTFARAAAAGHARGRGARRPGARARLTPVGRGRSASLERAERRQRLVEPGQRDHPDDRRGLRQHDVELLLAAAHLLAGREQQVDAGAVQVGGGGRGRRPARARGW